MNDKDIDVILKDIKEDWDWQVKDLSDEDLKEDRSYWMKYYGDRDEDDPNDEYESDIHTLAIEIEQLRRMGMIYYDERLKPLKNRKPMVSEDNLMNEVDVDKVTQAFSYFILSRLKDDEITNTLSEFRTMFNDMLMKKGEMKLKTDYPNDEVTQTHKDNELKRDVETTTERSIEDLSQLLKTLQLDKGSWKKYLRDVGF